MDIPRKKIIESLKQNGSDQEISHSDSKVYNFLDENLEKEGTHSFSPGFAKNITRKIEMKQQRRHNVAICSLVFLLVLMTIPLFISFVNTEIISMIFTLILENKFKIAFSLFLVILFQFGEKFINRRKHLI